MKRYFSLFVPLLALLFIGAGCSITPYGNSFGSCVITTPWGSCIDENGVDDSLLGTWQLTDQTISGPAGSVSNPFTGRLLTFRIDTLEDDTDDSSIPEIATHGSYSEDWSTESGGDVTTVGSIASECVVSGTADGGWSAWSGLDLDNPDSDGNFPTVSTLDISPAGGGPLVECNAGGSTVTSTAASTPLGTGPSTLSIPGGGVEYTYSVSGDMLVLVNYNTFTGVTNTLTFSR
jgi:hypothetical protein